MNNKIKLSDLVKEYEIDVPTAETDLELAIELLIKIYKEDLQRKNKLAIKSSLLHLISCEYQIGDRLVSLNDWSE